MEEIQVDAERAEALVEKHRCLWNSEPPNERLVMFGFSEAEGTDMRQVWQDPQKSMEFSLKRLAKVLASGDDSIPMVRIEFGSVLPAMAFGSEVKLSQDGWPAVKTHPILSSEELSKVRHPDPRKAGAFVKAHEFIKYFREHLPAGVRLCQCDMQGPWNTAHLITGDKIFYDIYDQPDFVAELLDAAADLIIGAVPPMKQAIGEAPDSFFLQGTVIPGGSRVCNCSTDMISPEFYDAVVRERDVRFYEAVGGGMMHICGNNSHCIRHFNKIEKLHGLEINFNYLDLFEIADLLREDIVLLCTGPVDPPLLTPLGEKTLNCFAKGEFPHKKNILFNFNDPVDDERCKWLMGAIKG